MRVIDYLPSPLIFPPVKGMDPEKDKEVERPAEDDAPLSALVFKIVTDPYVGSPGLLPCLFRQDWCRGR